LYFGTAELLSFLQPVMLDLPCTRACAEVKAPVKYYIRSWNWCL